MLPFARLLVALEEIRDPRRGQGKRYTLPHMLLFAVLAVLAGATSYQSIITFISLHRERLNQTLRSPLPPRTGSQHPCVISFWRSTQPTSRLPSTSGGPRPC